MGITSVRDSFVIDFKKEILENQMVNFSNPDIDEHLTR